jgi:hypothetical protein
VITLPGTSTQWAAWVVVGAVVETAMAIRHQDLIVGKGVGLQKVTGTTAQEEQQSELMSCSTTRSSRWKIRGVAYVDEILRYAYAYFLTS